GQTLVSEVVRSLVGSRGGHQFRSMGALTLKGLGVPVPAAAVIRTPVAAPVAPTVARHRHVRPVLLGELFERYEHVFDETRNHPTKQGVFLEEMGDRVMSCDMGDTDAATCSGVQICACGRGRSGSVRVGGRRGMIWADGRARG
ncbi:MAG: hypothetical protein QOH28_2787, partial [Actinomycetota bacterium]|nr:hypothetical protein [Actinomycetota bacterium]